MVYGNFRLWGSADGKGSKFMAQKRKIPKLFRGLFGLGELVKHKREHHGRKGLKVSIEPRKPKENGTCGAGIAML